MRCQQATICLGSNNSQHSTHLACIMLVNPSCLTPSLARHCDACMWHHVRSTGARHVVLFAQLIRAFTCSGCMHASVVCIIVRYIIAGSYRVLAWCTLCSCGRMGAVVVHGFAGWLCNAMFGMVQVTLHVRCMCPSCAGCYCAAKEGAAVCKHSMASGKCVVEPRW
jgi:hypothetical protein